MDELDWIQQRDEPLLALQSRYRRPVYVSQNGRCLWCLDAPVSGGSRAFCSTECGEDFEKTQRAKGQRGNEER